MSVSRLILETAPLDLLTVPQPEAVPQPVMLLGPRSKVGFAEDGVAVMTVMVFNVDVPVPELDGEADTVMVVLEMTMTEETEDNMLDKDDEKETGKDKEDEDEDLGDDVDVDRLLELDGVLPSVGAVEPEAELLLDLDEDRDAEELLLDIERDNEDDVDEIDVKVLIVRLLTNVVLLVKSPLPKMTDVEMVALGRQEDGIEVERQQGRAKVAVVDGEKTPV